MTSEHVPKMPGAHEATASIRHHSHLGESNGSPQTPQSLETFVSLCPSLAPPPPGAAVSLPMLSLGHQGQTHLGQFQGRFLTDPGQVGRVTEDLGDAQFAQDSFQVVGSRNGQFGQM